MQACVRLSVACVLVRARAALLAGGGEEVAGAYLGCNTTHVVCNPETAAHWLSMGALRHSPVCFSRMCDIKYTVLLVCSCSEKLYLSDSFFQGGLRTLKQVPHVHSL